MQCCEKLKQELPSQQFSLWIRPLYLSSDSEGLVVYAPNRFVSDWVKDRYYDSICLYISQLIPSFKSLRFKIIGSGSISSNIEVEKKDEEQTSSLSKKITCSDAAQTNLLSNLEPPLKDNFCLDGNSDIKDKDLFGDFNIQKTTTVLTKNSDIAVKSNKHLKAITATDSGDLNVKASNNYFSKKLKQDPQSHKDYTFDLFIEGKSNQIARAASMQVCDNIGSAYNPLFICGETGLGKTHLLHSIKSRIIEKDLTKKVVYVNSETFVQNMIFAIQKNAVDSFKYFYRDADALLIDDIQFFSKKDRSQEELFHVFNYMINSGSQIVLSSDQYPKDLNGFESRLISRFSSGLTVSVAKPDLETRISILIKKAFLKGFSLPYDVAEFIAENTYSNIRELTGLLNSLIMHCGFNGFQKITVEAARSLLRDLIKHPTREVSVKSIQKAVADFYNIKLEDLLSRSRNRSLAWPRQLAMSLCKDLTNLSFPEIGSYFNNRDHSTVFYACKKVKKLCDQNFQVREAYSKLSSIILS